MRLLTERVSSIRLAGDSIAHTLVNAGQLRAILTESKPPLLSADLISGMHDIIAFIAATPYLGRDYVKI